MPKLFCVLFTCCGILVPTMTGKYFHPVSSLLCHSAGLLGQYFHILYIFGILLRQAGDPMGRRRQQPCIRGERWRRWTGKLPWNCPLSLSPSYQLPLLCFAFRLKGKFWSLIFYRKILTQPSCIMARRVRRQLWVKSSMKCTYFMVEALFDGEDYLCHLITIIIIRQAVQTNERHFSKGISSKNTSF